MIHYRRLIRMENIEIFRIVKSSVSMGYLIIEDLRRNLNDAEKQLLPFRIMDEEELAEYKNLIKIYILSDEELTEEDRSIFEEFAMDLVDLKDGCLYILESYVDEQLFIETSLDLRVEDYQKILHLVHSSYDISKLDLRKTMYLSQE